MDSLIQAHESDKELAPLKFGEHVHRDKGEEFRDWDGYLLENNDKRYEENWVEFHAWKYTVEMEGWAMGQAARNLQK